MALNLGTVYASAQLDTSKFRSGVQEAKGLVGQLGSIFAGIPQIAIGTAVGGGVEAIVRSIADIPKALIQANSEVESGVKGMTSTFENAASQASTSWEQAMGEVGQATEKEAGRVVKLAQQMGEAMEDAAAKAAEFGRQFAEAGADRQQATGRQSTRYDDQVEDSARGASRNREDFVRSTETATKQFNSSVRSRDREFAKSMSSIEKSHQRSTQDRAKDEARSAADMAEQWQKNIADFNKQQAERSAQFARQMAELSRNHTKAISSINRDWDRENKHFQQAQGERADDFARANRKMVEDHAKTMRAISSQINQVMSEAAAKVQQVYRQLAQQMAAIRQQEEESTLDFSQQMEDLNLKSLAAATPDERAAVAKERQRLQAQQAVRQQGLALATKTAQSGAAAELESIERAKGAALKALGERKAEEIKAYKEREEEVKRSYERETRHANQAHAERVADLQRALAEENEAYARQAAELARQKAEEDRKAREALAEKQEELRRAHQQRMEDNAEAARREQEDYEQKKADAREAYEEQTRIARENLEEQTRVARENYARQSQDQDIRDERMRQSNRETLEDIDARWQRTTESIERAQQQEAVSFARTMNDMREEQGRATDDLAEKSKNKLDEILSRNGQVTDMFKSQWVESANAAQAALGREFRFNVTTDAAEKAEQIKNWARDMATVLPSTFREILQTSDRLMAYGLDPVDKGLLRIVTALAQLPGVTGGIDQVANAFGALATGQTGEAVMRFREFGVNLKTIPGLTFDAAGALKTSIPEAMRIVLDYMGPRAERVLTLFQGSFAQMFSNLKDSFELFQAQAGESLFEKTKAALADFNTFLTTNKDQVETIARTIGEALGGLAEAGFNAFRELGKPENIQAVGTMISQLGALKDSVAPVVGAFLEGTGLKGAFAETGNAARDFMGQVTETARIIAEHLTKPETLEFVKQLGADIKAAFTSEENKQFLRDIGTGLGIVVGWIKDWEKAQAGLNRFNADFMGSGLVTFLTAIDNAAKPIRETMKVFLDAGGILGALGRAFGAAGEPAGARQEDTAQELNRINAELEKTRLDASLVNPPLQAAGEQFQTLGTQANAAKEKLAEWAGAVRPAVDEANAALAEGAAQFGPTLEEAGIGAAEQLAIGLGTAPERIRQRINATPGYIRDAVQPDLDDAVQAVEEWVPTFVEAFRELEGTADEVRHALENVPTVVEETLHEIHGSGFLMPWLEAFREVLVDGVTITANETVAAFEGVADAIGEELVAASDEVSNFVENLGEGVRTVEEDLANLQNRTGGLGGGGGGGEGGGGGTRRGGTPEEDARQRQLQEQERQRAEEEARRRREEQEQREREERERREREARETRGGIPGEAGGPAGTKGKTLEEAMKEGISGGIEGPMGGLQGALRENTAAVQGAAAATVEAATGGGGGSLVAGMGTTTVDYFAAAMGIWSLSGRHVGGLVGGLESAPQPVTNNLRANVGTVNVYDGGVEYVDALTSRLLDRIPG